MMDEKLYTTQEVAIRFNRHPRTINRWVKNGELEALRLPNGEYQFKPEFLIRFEERLRTGRQVAHA